MFGHDKIGLGLGFGDLEVDEEYVSYKGTAGNFKVPRRAVTSAVLDRSFSLIGQMATFKLMGSGGELAKIKIPRKKAEKAQEWLLEKLYPKP